MERVRLTLVVMAILLATVSGQEPCTSRDGQRGTCISISDCPSFLRQLQSATNSPGTLERLRSFICKFVNGLPHVCCPFSQPKISEPGRVSITLPGATPPTGASLLPSDCGTTILADRIVGGDDAPLMTWPWIVLLRGTGLRGSLWICGGALISDRYVLTAAHCVHSSAPNRLDYVRVGEHRLDQTPDCENNICAPAPQDIVVEQVLVHEQYQKVPGCNLCHDIALLRLAQPARLIPRHVVPVCLPRNLERDLNVTNRDFTGKFGWTAGWGATHRVRDDQRPAVLQEVLLPISDEFCTDKARYPDRDMIMCAGGEGRDSCRGDSGGPLILPNKVNRHYVVGVVSKGPEVCGASRTQGVYTNVAFYLPWIIRNLRP